MRSASEGVGLGRFEEFFPGFRADREICGSVENVENRNARTKRKLYNYAKDYLGEDGTRAFFVPSGALGVSVGIFSCCALTCLATLYYRRVTYGAELGGDQKVCDRHAIFFISLWFVYVGGSAIVEEMAK